MKYWELLLRKQRERGRDGLTLPFLIGSQEYLTTTHKKQSIEDLILDMVSNQSFETCIRYCMGTQTLIWEIKKPKNNVYYPIFRDQEQRNLSVASLLKSDLGDNIEILIERLIADFQDTIDKALFSAEPDTYDRTANWKAFSVDEDIPFIKSSFNTSYITK